MTEQVKEEILDIEPSPHSTEEEPVPLNGEPLFRAPSEARWSIFNKREKVLIVILGSLAAFLSPLTANI
jgi:hypothetical protein